MKCPECKTEMIETLRKIKMRRAFEGLVNYKRRAGKTQHRPVYECPGCAKAFIRTLALVEVEVLGH